MSEQAETQLLDSFTGVGWGGGGGGGGGHVGVLGVGPFRSSVSQN